MLLLRRQVCLAAYCYVVQRYGIFSQDLHLQLCCAGGADVRNQHQRFVQVYMAARRLWRQGTGVGVLLPVFVHGAQIVPALAGQVSVTRDDGGGVR